MLDLRSLAVKGHSADAKPAPTAVWRQDGIRRAVLPKFAVRSSSPSALHHYKWLFDRDNRRPAPSAVLGCVEAFATQGMSDEQPATAIDVLIFQSLLITEMCVKRWGNRRCN
jgi:hypothetical protein